MNVRLLLTLAGAGRSRFRKPNLFFASAIFKKCRRARGRAASWPSELGPAPAQILEQLQRVRRHQNTVIVELQPECFTCCRHVAIH
jgi:hypothetical protein